MRKKIIAEEGKEVLIRKLKHLKIPFTEKELMNYKPTLSFKIVKSYFIK